jgi:hypothetical protein
MGPYSAQTIQEKLDTNEFGLMHEILANNAWVTLERFFQPPPAPNDSSAVGRSIDATREPPSAASYSTPPPLRTGFRSSPKSRVVYVLLAAFVGFTGAHNFYAGAWIRGLFQLLLAAAGYRAGCGIFIPWLWAGAEMLLVRRDGKGRRLA